jgi:uncharacterized protein (UPF0332 family)
MDTLIKYIIKNEYLKLEETLKMYETNSGITYEERFKLCYFFILMGTNDVITDEKLFIITGIFLRKTIKLTDLNLINKINLQPKKYKLTVELLATLQSYYNTKHKLNIIVNKLKDTTGSIKKYFKGDIIVDKLKNIIDNNISQIIFSFNEHKFMNALSESIQSNKIMWERIYTIEMTNRLKALVTIFGLNTLKFMGVTPMINSEFNNMSYSDKTSYFKNSIENVDASIKYIKFNIKKYDKLEVVTYNLNERIKILIDIRKNKVCSNQKDKKCIYSNQYNMNDNITEIIISKNLKINILINKKIYIH